MRNDDQGAVHRPRSLWKIGKTPIKLTLDDGAALNVISEKLYKEIEKDCEELPITEGNVVLATGAEEKVLKKVETTVICDTYNIVLPIEAEVIRGNSKEMWIGRPALSDARIIIDYGTHRSRVSQKWIPLP
jgi:hypothetical protein